MKKKHLLAKLLVGGIVAVVPYTVPGFVQSASATDILVCTNSTCCAHINPNGNSNCTPDCNPFCAAADPVTTSTP